MIDIVQRAQSVRFEKDLAKTLKVILSTGFVLFCFVLFYFVLFYFVFFLAKENDQSCVASVAEHLLGA